MTPNRKFLTGGALAALAVLFVAAILISNALFRGVRIDLTQNRLYTLSQGTKNILADIKDPIHLYLFFSDSGSGDLPQLRVYAQRVRDMLSEMASRSGGKLTVEVIDPQPFSEDEDRATAYGLQGVPTGVGDENIYFGLAGTNSGSGKAVIPFLQPDKETFLEYDIAKLIQTLSVPKKPLIGMISGLPMVPGFDPMVRQMMGEPWAIETQLRELFDIRELDATSLKAIDPDLGVLVVVHPKALSDDAQYAIDQFVMRGGRLLVFVDPNAETDQSGADPNDPRAAMLADKSSDLPALFKAWGVEYDRHKAVLDRAHGLPVVSPQGKRVRVASILGFGKRELAQDEVITGSLDRINVSSAGFLSLAKDSKYKLVPLIETGTDAMVVPVERVKLVTDPNQLLEGYKPDYEKHIIAARLEGKFKSAFPDRKDAGHLAEAKAEGQIIVVADTDLLSNRLWVQIEPAAGGRRVLNPFANNGDLFINAIDYLAGSPDLISIRGRAISQRPFTRVEDMRTVAEESFRGKERELRQQLMVTERNLAEIQGAKGKQNDPLLAPAQQKELRDFMQKKMEIRKDLRQVRRGLDEQLDALGTRLKLINIGLVPLLITLGALTFAWWRRRQRTV